MLVTYWTNKISAKLKPDLWAHGRLVDTVHTQTNLGAASTNSCIDLLEWEASVGRAVYTRIFLGDREVIAEEVETQTLAWSGAQAFIDDRGAVTPGAPGSHLVVSPYWGKRWATEEQAAVFLAGDAKYADFDKLPLSP